MHLTPNISYPLMIAISMLMLPVMIVRFYMGVFQMVADRLPADCSVVLVYLCVLSVRAEGAVSENLVEIDRLPAHADGGRSGTDG